MLAWPLVGRDEELAFVADALVGDGAGGVVIAGELGVGKTRLAREAIAAVEDRFAVEWVAATAASSAIPFGALAHLVDDDAVGSAEDRLRMARAITTSLERRAGDRPLLLVVDDAQWLDAGAAVVVHQLIASGRTKGVLTVRTEELAPGPVVACWKDGWTERLELQPLSSLDLDALVASVVQRPVDGVTLNRLWSLSQGNPLFVHELVVGALETDAFTISDGVWSWTGPRDTSSRLLTVLESRLTRVTAAGRSCLEALAVGEPLAVDLLVQLHGPDALVEVEQAGLATVVLPEGRQVRLGHPVYGEALRAAMGTVDQRRVMTQLADLVGDATELAPTERLRVAVWRLDGRSSVEPDLLTDAAQIANGRYDHPLAERLARQAVADGAGFAASLVLGDALNRQGRFLEGLAVLDPIVTDARTDDEHVAVAVSRYYGLTSEHGFRPEFADDLLAAEARVSDRRLVAFLRAQRASLLGSAGRLDEGVALALQTIEDDPSETVQLRAVSPLAGAWLCSGRTDAACALTERMLEPAFRLRDQLPQAPGWVMSLHLPALLVAGRLDDADAATDFLDQILSASSGTNDAAAIIAISRGMSGLFRGQVRTGHDWLRRCVALLRPVARWRLPMPLVNLVHASALVGDPDGAAAASAEADELVVHHAAFEGTARWARGWAAMARGERSIALDLFLEAADWSAAHGQHTAELNALHDAVRFGAAREAADRLQVLAERTEGEWAPRYAGHARAIADGDGEALEVAAAGFEQMGALLLAAEANAEASGVFTTEGLRSRAQRAAGRASQLAAQCEDAHSPVLEELERPLPLTRREREVATLAAEGHSAQAIAERLYVSARTVEGHLQSAYGKLGVNDRAGLADVLARGIR